MTGRIYYQVKSDKLKGENEKWLKREQSQQKLWGDLYTIFSFFLPFFSYVWFLTVYETDSFIKCVFLPMWLPASFGLEKKPMVCVYYHNTLVCIEIYILGSLGWKLHFWPEIELGPCYLFIYFFNQKSVYSCSLLFWRLLVMR